MKTSTPENLIKRYKNGDCTAEEIAIVESWHLKDLAESNITISEESISKASERMRLAIAAHRQTTLSVRRLWPRYAAASILLLLTAGIYFMVFKNQKPIGNAISDVRAGGSNATLTLANGKKVSLTNIANGLVTKQPGTIVTKIANGLISYSLSNGHEQAALSYNTLATPNGGEYQLVLPDGSKAWLNAASSLKFPTAFFGGERKVELKGEAYFEVVHNSKAPFRVITKGQVIEDIGTHFNINAYPDEAEIKTTLIEGAVKVSGNNAAIILKPGEQTVLKENHLSEHNANIEETMAWKNGYFRFNDEKIPDIMRKLGRWYNVEIEYNGPISKELYNGTISRYRNISQVLKMLSYTNTVHFKVEGRRILVMP
jgi:transmembrane sensor